MSTSLAPERQALLDEGDRLARTLAQTLHCTLDDQPRLVLLGRSLAVNLLPAFQDTLELISRRMGRPQRGALELDELGRLTLQTVDSDGVLRHRLGVDDLIAGLLFIRGRLEPTVRAHLQGGLSGDEHHATRALVQCLNSRPVLRAMQRQISALLG